MTDDECREAYENIDGMGFALVDEVWLTKAKVKTKAKGKKKRRRVKWHAILAAAPYLSLNDLDQIEELKRLRADKPSGRPVAKKRAKFKLQKAK